MCLFSFPSPFLLAGPALLQAGRLGAKVTAEVVVPVPARTKVPSEAAVPSDATVPSAAAVPSGAKVPAVVAVPTGALTLAAIAPQEWLGG